MADPVLAFVVFFAALWAAIFTGIAVFGGWRRLAAAYPAMGPAQGRTWRFRSARFGRWTGYNNCLEFSAGPAGLHLVPFVLFRIAHPAIFVPWSDIHVTAARVWGFPVATFTFLREPGLELHVPGGFARQLAEESGGMLRLPDAVVA